MATLDGVRKLFGGSSLSTPRDDDAPAGANSGGGQRAESAGPTEDAVNALVVDERKSAASDATKAANDRWNAVMTSDQGKKNPAAAARLLSTTTMSSDDVKATLDDLAPAGAEAPAKPQGNNMGQERQALADDPNANPDTGGGAAAGTNQRKGEGDDGKNEGVKSARAKRAEKAAAAAAAGKGKMANAGA